VNRPKKPTKSIKKVNRFLNIYKKEILLILIFIQDKKIVANQIKKELVIEKLLSIIDLPVIENLLSIDELNGTEQIKDENHNNLKTRSNFATRSKSVSLLEPLSSLKILHQTYDLTKSDE
jgi:hypothetical protein